MKSEEASSFIFIAQLLLLLFIFIEGLDFSRKLNIKNFKIKITRIIKSLMEEEIRRRGKKKEKKKIERGKEFFYCIVIVAYTVVPKRVVNFLSWV